jgi:hypothetical protein
MKYNVSVRIVTGYQLEYRRSISVSRADFFVSRSLIYASTYEETGGRGRAVEGVMSIYIFLTIAV